MEFAAGSEHLFWLLAASGDWCSGAFFTGPCTRKAKAVVLPHPLALRTTGIQLRKPAADAIDSFFHAGWHEIQIDSVKPDAQGKARLRVLSGAHGLTSWLRVRTAAGPFQFPLGSAGPPGLALPLALPELASIRIRDPEGKPVRSALVALAWNGKGKFPAPYLVFQGQSDLGSTWEAGLTDAAGRIAIPVPQLYAQELVVLAWGFRPWRGEIARVNHEIRLERDEILERSVDFAGCETSVFSNDSESTVHCAALRPRFRGGRFHVPAELVRYSRGRPAWSKHIAMRARLRNVAGPLEYWSPSGYSFRLDAQQDGDEPIKPQRRVRRARARPSWKGGLLRFGRVPLHQGLQGTRLLGATPSVAIALCRTVQCNGRGNDLPQVTSASVVLDLPRCAGVAFDGDAARSDRENGHAGELSFSAEPGTPTRLSIRDGKGKPIRGARLLYYFEGRHREARKHFESQAGTAPKKPFIQLRGSIVPNYGDPFDINVPNGCSLAFAAELPDFAPVFGRVKAGEQAAIVAEEPAWALVHGVDGLLMVQCLESSSDQADPAVLGNLMPGSPRFVFRAPLSLIGCDFPAIVGPLPPGTYSFQVQTS